jgi:hypothetical protein
VPPAARPKRAALRLVVRPSRRKEFMALKAKKAEHNGSKRGKGAYYGRKRNAKKESNRIRRDSNKSEIREHLHLISPQ